MKLNRFDYSNLIAVQLFLGQFKRVCDFNGALEGIAMCHLKFFIATSRKLFRHASSFKERC